MSLTTKEATMIDEYRTSGPDMYISRARYSCDECDVAIYEDVEDYYNIYGRFYCCDCMDSFKKIA